MAKIETVNYRCDICGKFVNNETELSQIELSPGESFRHIKQKEYPMIPNNPLKGLPEFELPRLFGKTFDACDNCMMRFYRYIGTTIASENEQFLTNFFL